MIDRPTKVAIVTAGFAPVPAVRGGAVETLVTQLVEKNEDFHKMDIDLFTIKDELLDSFKYKHTKIIQIPLACSFQSIMIRCINRICKIVGIQMAWGENDFNIAKCITPSIYDYVVVENNMHIYQLLHRKDKAYRNFCFHLHNSIVNDPGKSSKQSKEIAKTAEVVMTVSDYIRKQFSFYRSQGVYTLYNCVDIELFKPEPKDFQLARDLGIDEGSFIILFSGRLTPEKGLLELINAIRKLSEKHQICLLIAGRNWFGSYTEGQYGRILEKETKDCKWIKFTGYIQHHEMYKYYNLADVTVVPSLIDEAFGLSALESLLCATPVICSNIGGLSEVVDCSVGALVEINDSFVENLAKSIDDMISNPQLYNEYKKNSRNLMIKKFYTIEEYYNKFYGYLTTES